jgi:hypothetical protein
LRDRGRLNDDTGFLAVFSLEDESIVAKRKGKNRDADRPKRVFFRDQADRR